MQQQNKLIFLLSEHWIFVKHFHSIQRMIQMVHLTDVLLEGDV